MQEAETCSICKKSIPLDRSEVWHHEDGNETNLKTSLATHAIADTSLGELTICEDCVENELPSYLTKEDKSEIYYQFALDLSNSGNYERAISLLMKTEMSADTLSSLGYCYDQLGNFNDAKRCYEKALKMAPDHFIATNNLRLLIDRSQIAP